MFDAYLSVRWLWHTACPPSLDQAPSTWSPHGYMTYITSPGSTTKKSFPQDLWLYIKGLTDTHRPIKFELINHQKKSWNISKSAVVIPLVHSFIAGRNLWRTFQQIRCKNCDLDAWISSSSSSQRATLLALHWSLLTFDLFWPLLWCYMLPLCCSHGLTFSLPCTLYHSSFALFISSSLSCLRSRDCADAILFSSLLHPSMVT